MSTHWILDGYNVLHAMKIMDGGLPLEVVRHKLILMAEKFQSVKNVFLILVFDGVESDMPPEPVTQSSMFRIVFSNGIKNADGVILQLLTKNNAHVTVVTGDMLLRDAIIRKGGNVTSPENFYREFLTLGKHGDHVIQNIRKKAQQDFNCPFKHLL